MNEILRYQTEGDIITARQAAEQYARTWPDGDRKVKWLSATTFRFADGNAVYKVRYVPAVQFKSWALWQICQSAEEESQ